MIHKLQRRFVLITMCALSLAVFFLVGTIDIVSVLQVNAQYDELLQILAENDGIFPQMKDERRKPGSVEEGTEKKPPEFPWERDRKTQFSIRISEETAFETRYFSVRVLNDGSEQVDLRHIAAISEEDALGFAEQVKEDGKNSGYLSYYRYLCTEKEDGLLYIFIDCQNGLQAVKNYFLLSLLAGIGLILVVLIPVIVFSRRATRPVLESSARQKQFITDAGHELKTPLAIISANAEVLELCGGENEWTQSIRNQIERMNVLISNLLTLSRLDEQQETETSRRLLFGEMVQNAADSFAILALGKKLIWETEIDSTIVVKGNASRLNQLIMILTDNAVKYTPEGGRVSIRCSQTGKQICYQIWNTCDSLSKQETSRLFDRFYRADHSRARNTGGYGIGLSAARAIVKAHKGKISAEMQDDGILFEVKLPCEGKKNRS